jgi:hypothetical protein
LQSCLINYHKNMIISPLIASLPLLFCLAFHFTNATTTISTRTDTILPGQSLDTTYWIGSTGGSYYLGFFSPEKNSTKLYLVIYRWYLSYNDIVWVANREHPFPNSFAAVLTFNQDGNLVISNGSLLYVIANTSGGNDTYAKLLDTGNLILTNRASHILWQSFDHPTDTLLPGMKIKAGKTGWPLTSWQSDVDPAPGLFSLQYLGSRKELVLMKGSQQYWSSPVLIDHVSLKYWLSFVIKMKRKEPSVRMGFIAHSDVMQSRTSVLKPESSVRRLVRIPFAARPDAFERAAPRLKNAT